MASYKGPKQRNHCEARSVSAIRQTGDLNVYWFNYRGCMEYQATESLVLLYLKAEVIEPTIKVKSPR